MKFQGGQQADILFQYQATVAGEEGVKYAIYDSDGRCFENLNAVIESSVISLKEMRSMTYDDFAQAEKDENSRLMNNDSGAIGEFGLLQTVNKTAAKHSGYKFGFDFCFPFRPFYVRRREIVAGS